MNAKEAESKINRAIREVEAVPRSCPWCGFSGMLDKHAPKKHPEEWEEWKAEHERLTVTRTIWVEGE